MEVQDCFVMYTVTIMWAKQKGFTIVELLIVIVVIAILAAISIVAYNGIQARSNDARIRSAVNQLEKAMIAWSVDNGSMIRGGSGSTVAAGVNGCTDGAYGWFGSGNYTCSAEDTLVSGKVIPSGFTAALPKNTYANTSATNGRFALMLYGCGTGKYILFWTLQVPTTDDTAQYTSARTECGYGSNDTFRTNYGMQGAKVINLQ